MNFLDTLKCWIRIKDDTPKSAPPKNIQFKNIKKQHLTCAKCSKPVVSIDAFIKLSKCGDINYGFCSENCYNKWLDNPFIHSHNAINEMPT